MSFGQPNWINRLAYYYIDGESDIRVTLLLLKLSVYDNETPCAHVIKGLNTFTAQPTFFN